MFLNISQISPENAFTRVSFLIKLQALRHKCFSVKFAKFLRTIFLQNTSKLLLLSIKERTKQTSWIFKNFNLILAEWKIENENFQNIRSKTEKRAMEISNFLLRLWIVELPGNRISTNQVFLMKTMTITNNVVVCPIFFFSLPFSSLLYVLAEKNRENLSFKHEGSERM